MLPWRRGSPSIIRVYCVLLLLTTLICSRVRFAHCADMKKSKAATNTTAVSEEKHRNDGKPIFMRDKRSFLIVLDLLPAADDFSLALVLLFF